MIVVSIKIAVVVVAMRIMITTMVMMMVRRMVRMLLFDSLIAVGLPGDGNNQLLATITADP